MKKWNWGLCYCFQYGRAIPAKMWNEMLNGLCFSIWMLSVVVYCVCTNIKCNVTIRILTKYIVVLLKLNGKLKSESPPPPHKHRRLFITAAVQQCRPTLHINLLWDRVYWLNVLFAIFFFTEYRDTDCQDAQPGTSARYLKMNMHHCKDSKIDHLEILWHILQMNDKM